MYNDDTICKSGKCYWKKKCSEVPTEPLAFDFEFRLYDVTSEFFFNIPWSQFKWSGTWFGDKTSTCYIPIFNSNLKVGSEKSTVLIGNIFMKKYYLVFDMSPLEKGRDYIQIGIGLQNYGAHIGEQHYDSNSPNYLPEDKALDSSTNTGSKDAYDNDKYDDGVEKRKKEDEDYDDGKDGQGNDKSAT